MVQGYRGLVPLSDAFSPYLTIGQVSWARLDQNVKMQGSLQVGG